MTKSGETPMAGFPTAAITEAMSGAMGPFGGGNMMTDGMAMLGRWSAGPFGWLEAADAAKPAESPMEMWVSMFPTSPYFGVKWVFQDMAKDMTDGMQSFAGAMMPGDKAGLPFSATAAAEQMKLGGGDLGKMLERGASISGEGKAQQIDEQGDEENATVSVDVKKAVAAAKPAPKATKAREASAAEASAADAQAAAEKAALENVGVGAISDLAAVGGVAAAFSADLGKPAEKKKADLRVVGGSDQGADEAPQKPKGLFSKKPQKIDDLKQIRGVGPRLEKLLNEAGVYQFKQIAAFRDEDFAWLDDKLSTFKGRGLRDKWRDQAEELLKS
ncbi:MAG: hypothetical protein AAFR16_10745 [Pseudomonadota bacterium]